MITRDPWLIALDGQPHAIEPGTRLSSLVAQLGHGANDVATAVNGQFIPRAARDERIVHAGDSVTLFQPIVGG